MKIEVRETKTMFLTPRDVSVFERKFLEKVGKKMDESVDTIHKSISRKLQSKQSLGRTYKSGRGDGSLHTASLPGFPPNEDTGNLRRGFWQKKKIAAGILNMMFGIRPAPGYQEDYAVDLEFGNKARRIEPRPFFHSTIQEVIKSAKHQKAVYQIGWIFNNEAEAVALKKRLGRGKKLAG